MTPKRSDWYAHIAVGILVVVLIVLCYLLVRQYRIGAIQQTVSAERLHLAAVTSHRSLGVADVDLIEPWMTFDYISVSFKVPESYLIAQLAIATSTAGYPHVTIGHYAKATATTGTVLKGLVQNVVKNYLLTVATSTATSTAGTK